MNASTQHNVLGRRGYAWALAGCMALAGFFGPARADDLKVVPAAGGGFVVTNAAGNTERLRVNEDGSVTISGPVSFSGYIDAYGSSLQSAGANNSVTVSYLKYDDIQNPPGDIMLCLNTASGRLSRCFTSSYDGRLGTGAIYTKKETIPVTADFPIETFYARCNSSSDMAIYGEATASGRNHIAAKDWENDYLKVYMDGIYEPGQLSTKIVCMGLR